MGFDLAALLGLFGLSGVFALVGLVLAAWMAWRIVEKAGLPGWLGLGSILLTLTAVGTIVPLILLWIFAFMRWPRDDEAPVVALPGQAHPAPAQPGALPPPPKALGDRRAWRLSGLLPTGGTVAIAVDGTVPFYLFTGAAAALANELSLPDPSVGQPHARLLGAGGRLGLEDLGTPGGTLIDGARLLPEHGPREITAARTIRLGSVELALSRS